MAKKTIDVKILDYATSLAETSVIKAVLAEGSQKKAAKLLQISPQAVSSTVLRVEVRAHRRGYAPEFGLNKPVPPGYHIKGVSTLHKTEDGIQWVKTDKDKEDILEQVQQMAETLAADVKGLSKIVTPPKTSVKDLLTVYPMGDPHIGMYAWKMEAEDDFDCEIARRGLAGAMKHLVSCSPSTEIALIANLGDFFHADNMKNETWGSGAKLDVDTRWQQVIDLGILAMRDCIDLALAKHKKVIVINSIGNHDAHTSVLLGAVINAFYHNDPRVEVRPTVNQFQYYEFGKNLIGITHGDKIIKLPSLGELMAADMPQAWGRTVHRMWYTGHIHHSSKLELRGCTVESFRTLAPKDAWHWQNGFRSGRDMSAIILHKEGGEVSRNRVDISMIA